MEVVNRRYQIDEMIGSGGMGTVYRAFDRLNGEYVALKSITLSTDLFGVNSKLSVSIKSDLDDETSAYTALIHEFRTLSSLHHPNVIRVLDYGLTAFHPTTNRQPFFTMELLNQPQTLLEACAALPLEGKLDLIAQTLDALHYLHRRNVVHRDLKPQNVLVVDGHVWVLDFGLASQRGDWFGAEAGIAGTPRYLAPEVLLGEVSTPAADLYTLGIMLYEIFAGFHPFLKPGATGFDFVRRLMNETPDFSVLAHLPTKLINLIGSLLEKKAENRPKDASKIRNELYAAYQMPVPPESIPVRDSFLHAAAFVGREREFARLRDAITIGDARFWVIGGESGVGKSRLMDEIRTFALVNGVMVVRGTASADGGSPYHLWIAPLRQLVLTLSDLTPFEAGVLAVLIPDIETLTGVKPLSIPSFAPERLFNVMIEILRRQPIKTLIILEDIHWAGEGLTALEAIAPFLSQTPVQIFCTFRNDEAPDLLVRFSDEADLSLSRLPRATIMELCEAMLGVSGTKTAVIDLVERASEGNVFFIVETMRALAEEAGSLDLVGSKTLPENIFAGGMQRIIAHRIERVPPAARALLDIACVAGRTLDVAVLEEICGTAIEPILGVCASGAVLEFHVGDGWRFTHDKLREYLLSIQSEDRLPFLHRRIAQGIEAVYPNDITKVAALARHWGAAGEIEQELRYLPAAAHQAYDMGNLPAAQRYFERIHTITDDPKLLLDALIHLGSSRAEAALEPREAREAELILLRAHQLAIALNDTDNEITAVIQLGVMAALNGDPVRWLATFRDIFSRLATFSLFSQGVVLHAQGYVAYLQGQFADVMLWNALALEPALRTNNLWVVSGALRIMGWVLIMQEQWDEAERLLTDALAAARRLGRTTSIALALSPLGLLYGLRHQWAQAFAHCEEALRIATRSQHWRRIIIALGHLACLHWLQGDLSRMESVLGQIDARLTAQKQQVGDTEKVLRWALTVRQTTGESRAAALDQLDAVRRQPGFRRGEREVCVIIIRQLEQEGMFDELDLSAS